MIVRQTVLHAFDEGRCRDRAGNESNADRLEKLGRERFCRKPRPESVPISGHRNETGDAAILDEIADFGALHIGAAEITQREARVSEPWPGLRDTLGQILRIGSAVQRADGVAPDLPRRLRSLESLEKPL